MAALESGKKAPEFTLAADNGKKISLKDLRGKKVVLYFYPKDNTPGCTIQACEYTDLIGDFQKSKAVVLGVSKDDLDSHKKFKTDHKIAFPLLSDPDLKVHKKYGAWGEKNMYGKKSVGVIRTTVVIDEEGKVIKAGTVKAKGNAAKTLGLLN
jgi:thioredoxin-dependent peroxiredoxin